MGDGRRRVCGCRKAVRSPTPRTRTQRTSTAGWASASCFGFTTAAILPLTASTRPGIAKGDHAGVELLRVQGVVCRRTIV